MKIRRSMALLAFGLACWLSSAALSAQGGQIFKRYTQPQVVAGNSFGSEIVLLNSSSTTCSFGAIAHLGAGELDPGVVLGGQPGGFATGTVGPHSGASLSVESPEADFVGAVSVDLQSPECFNAFTVQTQYRVRGPGGQLSELFSYATPQSIKPGQCALAAIAPDIDLADGNAVVPGFAAVSVATLQNSQLCHTLKNNQGNPVTQEICQPTDGSHQAQLLTDIFTGGFESGDVSSWQVCFNGPTGSGPQPRIDPLFIDVVTEGGVTQFDGNEHQVKRPGCNEDEFRICLDDRFQVSVDFRNSPSAQMQPAQVGGVLPDQSGFFFFTDPDNFQLLVKILNGCPVSNHFWVFYGATTDVEYEITVTDTQSAEIKTYFNPLGNPAPAITDTSAFATCP